MAALVFSEWYGELSRAQLAAYRKFNVTPVDHDDLARVFGDDRAAIVRAVKKYSVTPGGFRMYEFMKDHR